MSTPKHTSTRKATTVPAKAPALVEQISEAKKALCDLQEKLQTRKEILENRIQDAVKNMITEFEVSTGAVVDDITLVVDRADGADTPGKVAVRLVNVHLDIEPHRR